MSFVRSSPEQSCQGNGNPQQNGVRQRRSEKVYGLTRLCGVIANGRQVAFEIKGDELVVKDEKPACAARS
jgi:hypothetical protein